uniref:phenylalanyl tRNA synthetase beta subunit n=1 Tax=Desmarestia aculeata TaxID=62298 RepID=UPI002E7966B3|nr:phenylalanyl tRNA synthetase beta subunit [Desmarestia aculeata]WAM62972.1 phenylalanyl tRNA synthetase beta subunit [Desmarestia aculeata]
MYISLKWVQEIIGLQNITLNNLLDRLTLAGFEIESIDNKKLFKNNDIILDISFTANRADVANIKGLMNEIITLFNSNLFLQTPINIKPLILLDLDKKNLNLTKNFYTPELNYNCLLKDLNFKFSNQYELLRSKYYLWEHYLQKKSFSKSLKNINSQELIDSNKSLTLFSIKSQKLKVSESPYWIKKRLISMNFKPINNIIDTIHYLLIETGQVFFTFDLKILEDLTSTSNMVFVPKYATNECLFSISESKIINLNSNILTLTINNKIVSIAGLAQNFNTLVNQNTSQILLQCGLYNPKEVKKSSKNLGLRTDYSLKLERQTDLNLIEQAYLRLTHIFWTQNVKFEQPFNKNNNVFIQKKNSSLLYRYIKQSESKIKIIYKNINQLIGPYKKLTNLSNFQIIRNLKLLNFKISFQTDQNCYIVVPLARQLDIEQEVDIIEEIVRIIGFNKFKPIEQNTTQFGQLTKMEKFKRRLRKYFLNLGFNESVHSILVKNKFPEQTKLENPLFNESSVLRLSLLSGLIEKVKYNQKNVGESFETFELGRVYKFLANGNKKELEVISGIFGGKIFRSNWDIESSSINWFEAKGLLENLFEKLNLSVDWVQPSISARGVTHFHPNRTTNLFIGKQIIGTFGQMHPSLALNYSLDKKTYLFEFNTELLNYFWQSKTSISYKPYSSYPISYVDLSFIVKKSLFFDEIKNRMLLMGRPLIKAVDLFDYYSKEPIKKDYCSLTFKLQFQSETRTLVNSEVTKIVKSIIFDLEENFDIKFQE